MFALETNFNPDVVWYTGQGCLNCGSNQSTAGASFGAHCVDLGADSLDGRIGLCLDCARQVGLLAGMVAVDALDSLRDSTAEALALIEERATEAAASEARARLDKDTIERLLGLVTATPDDEPSTK